MVQLSMPVATQMLLQVAERNIGQLTDIETDVYTGLASPGKAAGHQRRDKYRRRKRARYFGRGTLS
jgi:hypothetical protein